MFLVTRPQQDAEETATRLRKRGHTALVAPLIDIQFVDGPEISLDGVQAVLATSSNGVHALARRTRRRDVPLFAVGSQTARAARDAGFATVKSANGDALSLVSAAIGWANPAKGALLHAAGAETKGELANALHDAGFEVRTHVVYDAVAAKELSPAALAALISRELDAVLLFSPRSAAIFADCVAKARAVDACVTLTAICISPATAITLDSLPFRALRVATRPDQETLLALVE